MEDLMHVEEEDAAPPPAAAPKQCEVCGTAASKYCCPRCSRRTCSLACSNQHKSVDACSGTRDRTAFVTMQQFDDRTLMSDYRLLEDVQRAEDVARRHRPMGCRAQLPQALAGLVQQAERRGVRLLLMPPGLHKRAANTTRYVHRKYSLMWRVEWVFDCSSPSLPTTSPAHCAPAQTAASLGPDSAANPPGSSSPTLQADPQSHTTEPTTGGASASSPAAAATDVCVADERVNESSVLKELLQRHLTYTPGAGGVLLRLRDFMDAGVGACCVLMRKERTPANAVLYHLLDMEGTLTSQLAHKTVIEYPVLTVILKSQLGSYSLVPESTLPPPPTQQEQWLANQTQRAEHQKLYLAGQLPWQQQQQQQQKQQQEAEGAVEGGLSGEAAGAQGPEAPEAKRQCTGAADETATGACQLPPPPALDGASDCPIEVESAAEAAVGPQPVQAQQLLSSSGDCAMSAEVSLVGALEQGAVQ
ncbi:MAG: hypothetical protein WDW38_004117 [Sanguina aurantia]